MKTKYYAGFQLASLHTLCPLLLICFILSIAQLGAFGFYFIEGDGMVQFIDIFNHMATTTPFRMAIVGMTMFAVGDSFGKSGTRHFMRRLSISETHMGILWSINTLLCFLIIWCWEMVLLYLCNVIFQMNTPLEYWSHQSFFINCNNNNFLRTIFSMGDPILLGSHLVMFIGLALTTGSGMVNHWRGEQSKLWLCAMTLWGLCFQGSADGMDVMFGVIFAFIGGGAVMMMTTQEDKA